MKIIDLLNKIANGEELPLKVKYEDNIYELQKNTICGTDYGDGDKFLICDYIQNKYCIQEILNDVVEIIEEDKDIEKIKIEQLENNPNSKYIVNEYGTKCFLTKHSKIIADKVNELIDEVNRLKNN